MHTAFGRQLFSLASVLIVASSALIAGQPVWSATDDNYYRVFGWDYGGFHWTWNLSIPKSLYSTYKSVPDNERIQNGPGGYGFLATTKDSYVISLANALRERATKEGYGAYDEVSFILAFVQSLPYTSDNVTTRYDEYPRFPVETLVDRGGDCEDTSILFATITLILDYDTVFISPPSHDAVGIWGTNLSGSYYTYHDRTYYYCETTGDGYKIGDLPTEYEGVLANLYTINQNTQYVPSQGLPTIPLDSITPWLFLGLLIGIAITRHVANRRKKERENQGTQQQSPPLPPEANASD